MNDSISRGKLLKNKINPNQKLKQTSQAPKGLAKKSGKRMSIFAQNERIPSFSIEKKNKHEKNPVPIPTMQTLTINTAESSCSIQYFFCVS